ncbi:MAG: NYN domain-containing protein [Alphaproteobacteria bacterium]|nr:NYN domain-containing protein [Alphaproteobacteria bacterium]
MKRTYIYVDGFNLYYGALKDTDHKWLDLKSLFEKLLAPGNEIIKIKYYSARVSDKIKKGASARQHAYINAIKTIPEVEVIWGNFLYTEKTRRMVEPPRSYVKVEIAEEKGSDVNLASHLINDGWKDLYDVAVVVSNDTDLVEPIRIVKEELHKTVGIICPHKRLAENLASIPPSFIRHIDNKMLRMSQFSRVITRTSIKKPDSW